jgi:hypothetical protein
MSQFNFEVTKNGQLEPLTDKGLQIMVNPSEHLKNVSELLAWEEGIPYDLRTQTFDLLGFNLTALEEEYLYFLHGL